MMKDIYVILFVIVMSYIFVVSDKKKFDQQMMFILLTLMIVILYKLMHYKKLEGFVNINASEIQNWLTSSENVDATNEIKVGELSSKADVINENLTRTLGEITKLKDILLEKEKQSNVDDDYLSSLDTRNMQTMQNKELQKLQSDIENAKVMLSQLEIAKSTKKYPKIPVYSSCVISNADGSYNMDTPNASNKGNLTPSMQSQQPTMGGDVQKPQTVTPQQQNQQNLMLNKMLSNILQNGINLNFA